MDRYTEFSETETKPPLPPIPKLLESEKAAFGYLTIRKYIGFIGIGLPILIFSSSLFSEVGLLPSISDYYYTVFSPVFTGGLLLISIFLFASKSNDLNEEILNRIASFSGLAIIVFPTTIMSKFKIIPNKTYTSGDFISFIHYSKGFNDYVGYMHLLGAVIFFSTLIVLVFKKFIPFEMYHNSSSDNKNISKQKIQLYRVCGVGMITSLLIIILSNLFFEKIFELKADECIFPMTFLFESILLIFFGICWLTKSNSLDKAIRANN